ncbi:MAG: hypothetical protein ACI4LE_04290, partial [Faecalibacterium sp.]
SNASANSAISAYSVFVSGRSPRNDGNYTTSEKNVKLFAGNFLTNFSGKVDALRLGEKAPKSGASMVQ